MAEIKPNQKTYFTTNYLCTKTIRNWENLINFYPDSIQKINQGLNFDENEFDFFLLNFLQNNKFFHNKENKNQYFIITENFLNEFFFENSLNEKKNIIIKPSLEEILLKKKYIFIPIIFKSNPEEKLIGKKDQNTSLLILYENEIKKIELFYLHFNEKEMEYKNKIKETLKKFRFFVSKYKLSNKIDKFINLDKIKKNIIDFEIKKLIKKNDAEFIIIKIITESILEKNSKLFEEYFKFKVKYLF